MLTPEERVHGDVRVGQGVMPHPGANRGPEHLVEMILQLQRTRLQRRVLGGERRVRLVGLERGDDLRESATVRPSIFTIGSRRLLPWVNIQAVAPWSPGVAYFRSCGISL